MLRMRSCPAVRRHAARILTVLLAAGVLCLGHKGDEASATCKTWKLAVQAWTFNNLTFFEAVDNAKAAGLKYIEAFPGQELSRDDPGVSFDENAPVSVLAKAKKKLEEAGVALVNYGVVGLGCDEAQNRKVFDFAKVMGIETIVSEPEQRCLDLIEKLADEYRINVALHNHPEPSRYWSPDTVIEAVKGRSKRIGACADTGHWMRSGIDPVEAVKKLEGRIISLHFKDLNELGNEGAHDVHWGTGAGKAKAVLDELHRQGFKGVFSIEYEHNWGKNLPDVAACAKYFYAVAGEPEE